jgi:hypothetical protein
VTLELPNGALTDGTVVVCPYRVDDAEQLLAGAQDPDVVRFASVRWSSDSVEELRSGSGPAGPRPHERAAC